MKRFSRRPCTFAALAVSPLAIACAAALLHYGPATAAARAMKPAVTIAHYSFHPRTLTIKKDSTVIWVNRDDDVHTIKSTDGPEAFNSAALDSGSQFEFTFRHSGTYHYICTVHAYMHGVIVVR